MLLSLAMVALLLASCADTKKKEAEDAAMAEQTEMDEQALRLAEEVSAQAEFENNTVVAIAADNESFSTLVAAIEAADLVDALNVKGPFTVFAPVNEAFAALPEGTVDDLLKEENQASLQSILKYHVISGEYMAADVLKAIEANEGALDITSIQGENLTLTVEEGKVIITDANGNASTVVVADVDASNGVIHAIDKVIMPKS